MSKQKQIVQKLDLEWVKTTPITQHSLLVELYWSLAEAINALIDEQVVQNNELNALDSRIESLENNN